MNQPVTAPPQVTTYVLQFHRPPDRTPVADDQDPAAAQPPAVAHSLLTRTHITDSGFKFDQENIGESSAELELHLATNEDSTLFLEWGQLRATPPSGPTLTFRSIGAGQLSPTPDPDGFRHGTVMYEATGGTGVFETARGFITSNFLVNIKTGELYDTHVGILRLQ